MTNKKILFLGFCSVLGMCCIAPSKAETQCKNSVVACWTDGTHTDMKYAKGFPTTFYLFGGCSVNEPEKVTQAFNQCQADGGSPTVLESWTGEKDNDGMSWFTRTNPNATAAAKDMYLAKLNFADPS